VTRKRIVVLAFSFPPIAGIGNKRPLRFVRALQGAGHAVTVFSAWPPGVRFFYHVDTATATSIPAGVNVVRIPTVHFFEYLIRIRDKMRKRRHTGGVAKHAESTGGPVATGPSFTQRIIDAFMGIFSVPDRYVSWLFFGFVPLLLRTVLQRPALIYVTGPPWTPLVLAASVARLTGIPLVVDYRDPWTLNPYHDQKGRESLARRVERWILNRCRTVIVNTASMERAFCQSFPFLKSTCMTLYNGIDEKDKARFGELVKRCRPDTETIVISHIGTLYEKRIPRPFARALAEAVPLLQEMSGRFVECHFIGRVYAAPLLKDVFAAAGVARALVLPGLVAPQTAQEMMVRSTALLLLQSGTTLQLPAKIFEYGCTGRPIVAVTEPDSETADIVRRYGLGPVFTSLPDSTGLARELYRSITNPPQERRNAFFDDFNEERLGQLFLSRVLG